jgi:hypothetical protein
VEVESRRQAEIPHDVLWYTVTAGLWSTLNHELGGRCFADAWEATEIAVPDLESAARCIRDFLDDLPKETVLRAEGSGGVWGQMATALSTDVHECLDAVVAAIEEASRIGSAVALCL